MIKKIFYCLSFLSILIFVIYTQILQSSYDIIILDDLFVLFQFYEHFCHQLIDAYHARFFVDSIATLVGVALPLSFDIHPNCWIQTVGAGVRAFFITIICYLLSSSLFIFDKKLSDNKNIFKNITIFVFMLLFYFLYQIRFNHQFQATMYISFYGFSFAFIIFFIFWQKFIKYFCSEKTQNNMVNKEIIILCVLALLLGYSSEFFVSSVFCTLTLLVIWLKVKKNKQIKAYIFIYACSFIGTLLYITNMGFVKSCKAKELFVNTFTKIWFVETVNDLYRMFFAHFIYFFIVIIVLYVFLFYLKIENKKRKIVILSLYLVGVICFYLSMSFARYQGEEHYLYLCHFDILVQIQIALLFAIILQISFLSNYKNLKKTLTFIMFCCFLFLTRENLIDSYKVIFKNEYKDTYIFKYYNTGPRFLLERYKCEYIMLENIKNGRDLYDVQYSFRGDNFCSFTPSDMFCQLHMKLIYNVDYDINKYRFRIDSVEKLYDVFLSEGGEPLSKEELDKHDFNFLLKKYRKE